MEKVKIFGVEIQNIDFREGTKILEGFLKEDRPHKIFTPNTEIVMECKNNPKLLELVNSGDMIVPDGIGLIYGAKIKNKPLKERVTGFDLSMELLEIANRDNLSLYLLGAAPGVVELAEKNIKEKYENINVVRKHHGYFLKDVEMENAIIDEINEKKPDIVFVGLGFPKQEEWIHKNGNILKTKILIGNGGVIDILSGNAKRAPELFIKLNLEWFYRLIQDPKMIKRQMAIPKFLINILLDKESVK